MKISGPLHSFIASGKFGGLVFTKNGFARQYVPPTNPQTAAQQNQRLKLSAAAAFIKAMQAQTARQAIKTSTIVADKPQQNWHSYFMATYGHNLEPARILYDALSIADQTLWETQGTAFKSSPVTVPNAAANKVSPGLLLFTGAYTFYTHDIWSTLGSPDGENATAWYNAFKCL